MKCKDCPDILYCGDLDIHYCEELNQVVNGDDECMLDKSQDVVNHPSHYETGKFECIDVMVETQGVESVKNYCLCNCFKYLWRHNGKEGEVSIDKALWYLKKYVELRDGVTHE